MSLILILPDVSKVYSFKLELGNRSSQGIINFLGIWKNFICRKSWESLCKLHCLRLLPRKRTPEMTYEPKIFILRWFDGQTVGWLTSDDLNGEVQTLTDGPDISEVSKKNYLIYDWDFTIEMSFQKITNFLYRYLSCRIREKWPLISSSKARKGNLQGFWNLLSKFASVR